MTPEGVLADPFVDAVFVGPGLDCIVITRREELILMRVPLVDEPEDIPTIQSPNDGIYAQVNAHWPAWFLSRTRFDATLKEVGDVVFRWFTNEVWQFEGRPILLEGVLLRTKAARSPA